MYSSFLFVSRCLTKFIHKSGLLFHIFALKPEFSRTRAFCLLSCLTFTNTRQQHHLVNPHHLPKFLYQSFLSSFQIVERIFIKFNISKNIIILKQPNLLIKKTDQAVFQTQAIKWLLYFLTSIVQYPFLK